jgi:hypothetical protein
MLNCASGMLELFTVHVSPAVYVADSVHDFVSVTTKQPSVLCLHVLCSKLNSSSASQV